MSSPSEHGWVTSVQSTAAAAEHGHGCDLDWACVRQHYSIRSLCSAGEFAECQAWVNDLHQSASANFWGQAVHISPKISKILLDLCLQALSAHLWFGLQRRQEFSSTVLRAMSPYRQSLHKLISTIVKTNNNEWQSQGATDWELDCISWIRSVKRTSRFRSQNPSTSYETWHSNQTWNQNTTKQKSQSRWEIWTKSSLWRKSWRKLAGWMNGWKKFVKHSGLKPATKHWTTVNGKR